MRAIPERHPLIFKIGCYLKVVGEVGYRANKI